MAKKPTKTKANKTHHHRTHKQPQNPSQQNLQPAIKPITTPPTFGTKPITTTKERTKIERKKKIKERERHIFDHSLRNEKEKKNEEEVGRDMEKKK